MQSFVNNRLNNHWQIAFVFGLIFIFISCRYSLRQFVMFKNDKIEYMGRLGETDSCKEIYWSGSSIKIKFEGKSIEAILEDEHGDNFFNVIIDEAKIKLLHLDSTKKNYSLAKNLGSGIHTIELSKRTEWTNGKTKFYGFLIDENVKLFNIKPKERTIEYYGNSITAGYAIEDYSGKDSPEGTNTNNYNTYAAVTARHFNANYNCIVRSGIGITVSWFPMIMSEMYYRLNPADENSYWEFSKFQPDFVVINLLQNDSWLVNVPENDQFKNRFGNKTPSKNFIISSYQNFVKTIRSKYPHTEIICMLGNMDITKKGSVWTGYVEEAVAALKDKNIHTLFIPYKNTDGHPKVEEQKVLAEGLIKYIEEVIMWK